MSYGCYIVDDEAEVASLIIDYVNRHEELLLLGYEPDPVVAARKLTSGEIKADICFLDIQMAGIDGLELGKMVRHLTAIIFTTGYEKYALESYDLDAVDFLLKPVRYARFIESIEKAKRYLATQPGHHAAGNSFFFVKDVLRNTIVKISSSDVIYIEGHGNFVFLHLSGNQKTVMTNLSMTATAAKAPDQQWVQVHKGYIVNIAHVGLLVGNEIKLSNGGKVPLSRRYRNDFMDRLKLNRRSG